MAQEYYFFDSTKDDIRRFQARHLAEVIDTILQTGLLHKDGTPTIRVTANTKDMKVRVTPGKAVIKGHLYRNTEAMVLDIPKTNTVKRVVLRLDNNIDNRFIKVFVTEGDTMTPKPLVREGDVYELALCHIKYDASKGYLEQSDITDTRFDENLCGLAHSLITVPTSEYQKEWNEFVQRYEKWFQQHQNSSYATLDYVKKNDDELRRLIAEIQLGGGGGGVVEGTTFATDFELYQNIAIKDGVAKTTAINARSVVLDERISGLASGDGVTLYNNNQMEHLTVSSVSGTTVNFTTTITKTFKPGADLARSMGIAESGKHQYSFGGYGSSLALTDRLEKVTITNSGLAVTDIGIRETLLDDNIVYFMAGTRYGTYFFTYDMTTKKIVEQWKKPSRDVSMGFGNEGQVIVITNDNGKVGTAEFYAYKAGKLQRTETLSGAYTRVEVVKGASMISVAKSTGSDSVTGYTYSVDDSGYLTQKFFGKSAVVTHYLGNNVYLSHFRTNSYCQVIEAAGDGTNVKGRLFFGGDGKPLLVDIFDEPYVFQKSTNNTTSAGIAVSDVIEYTATASQSSTINAHKSEAGFTARNTFELGNKDVPAIYTDTKGKVFYMDSFSEFTEAPQSSLGKIETLIKDLGFTFMRMRGDKPYKRNGFSLDAFPYSVTSKGDTLNIELSVNGTIGEGTKLLENDVRFKLPKKSTGISAVIYTTSGVSVTAKLGKVELQKSVAGDKTQVSGLVTTASDELTITMKRLSVNNDGGLKRVTGGMDT